MREKLLELLQYRPFQPFRVYLTNGNVHTVRHPEQALLTAAFVLIGIPENDQPGPAVSDTIFVALPHVVKLEPLIAAAA